MARLRSLEKYKYSNKILLLLAGQYQDDANAHLFYCQGSTLYLCLETQILLWLGLLSSIVKIHRQDVKLNSAHCDSMPV